MKKIDLNTIYSTSKSRFVAKRRTIQIEDIFITREKIHQSISRDKTFNN